jgi:hypothetical protein
MVNNVVGALCTRGRGQKFIEGCGGRYRVYARIILKWLVDECVDWIYLLQDGTGG